jgi:hypothetical protein
MLAQDGLYLVLVQTLSAFFLNNQGLALYFNGQSLILARVESLNENAAAEGGLVQLEFEEEKTTHELVRSV